MKNTIHNPTILQKTGAVIFLFMLFAGQVSAHRSPVDCLGSGLSINLYSGVTQAKIGDSIKYSVEVFNGQSGGAVVCDAADITANIVTPDGQTHPISLLHTELSSGGMDDYSNVVTYTARKEDVKTGSMLTSTASVVGTIHQNDTNSQGGGNQGLNVTVLTEATPVPTAIPVPTNSVVPTPSSNPTPSPSNIPAVVPTSTPLPTTIPPGGGGTTFWSAPSPTPSPTPSLLSSSMIVVPTAVVAIVPVPYFPNAGLPPRGQDHSKNSGIISGIAEAFINSWNWLLEII